jgi:hypothetical protein
MGFDLDLSDTGVSQGAAPPQAPDERSATQPADAVGDLDFQEALGGEDKEALLEADPTKTDAFNRQFDEIMFESTSDTSTTDGEGPAVPFVDVSAATDASEPTAPTDPGSEEPAAASGMDLSGVGSQAETKPGAEPGLPPDMTPTPQADTHPSSGADMTPVPQADTNPSSQTDVPLELPGVDTQPGMPPLPDLSQVDTVQEPFTLPSAPPPLDATPVPPMPPDTDATPFEFPDEHTPEKVSFPPVYDDSRPVEERSEALFGEQISKGEKAAAEKDYKQAVYFYSVAAALQPTSTTARQKLNEARRLLEEQGGQ